MNIIKHTSFSFISISYLLNTNIDLNTQKTFYKEKNPLGPFEFIGEVMDQADSRTSHGSIVEFKGKWYIFYHNMSLSNNNYRRSICFHEITFDQDGKINRIDLSEE